MTFSAKLNSNLKSQYTENIVEDFYKPVLSEATLYRRVSGYFTSAGMDLYIDGLEQLAKNHGQAQFIISKDITEEDFEKIKKGYSLLTELEPLKISEQNEILNPETQKQLGNLAFMIAVGLAKVKVALTTEGIFHDKFGIISSGTESVYFNGSMNETVSGISRNYESINVDFSWDSSSNIQSRNQETSERFERLWNNTEDRVEVLEASDLTYEQIAKYKDQATIPEFEITSDTRKIEIPENTISFQLYGNTIVRIDNTVNQITSTDRKLRKGSDLTPFFADDNKTIKSNTTYKDVERIIRVTQQRAQRLDINVIVSSAVEQFISRNKYSIEQYKILGEVYKGKFEKFPQTKQSTFEQFKRVVQSEVTRPLNPLHLRAAYYEYEMARAANFSVPGSGKTAMVLGVFAYLNRIGAPESQKLERILVVSPINAFESWKHEFHEVFGNKKELREIDSQNSPDFKYQLKTRWGISNLILLNYESLPRYADLLKKLINDKTMLVFDEVHRIKNPTGVRAEKALEIANLPKFRYVLTGTPIPNTYKDIYNFLHILYANEYKSFFGWDTDELINPNVRKIEEINESLHPFFWRTNKKDLMVPEADPDITEIVKPSESQRDLAESIFQTEKSSLAILIRLIQASTNPSLVTQKINYGEFMKYDNGDDANDMDQMSSVSEKEFSKLLGDNTVNAYSKFDLASMMSPKFAAGIDLVVKLVSEGKKVLVWGIFVDTIKKIASSLRDKGISVNLVHGETDKNQRVELINEFRDGNIQVLVSNPQTLAESISLHQSVHDAVYFEYDFNLTFMLQSRDRIHRLGLKDNQYTRYYYLQTAGEDAFSDLPGYIDEKIYARLKEKENIMYSAIDDNTLSKEYPDNEIDEAIKIIDEERKRISK